MLIPDYKSPATEIYYYRLNLDSHFINNGRPISVTLVLFNEQINYPSQTPYHFTGKVELGETLEIALKDDLRNPFGLDDSQIENIFVEEVYPTDVTYDKDVHPHNRIGVNTFAPFFELGNRKILDMFPLWISEVKDGEYLSLEDSLSLSKDQVPDPNKLIHFRF